jgi:uridine kinase
MLKISNRNNYLIGIAGGSGSGKTTFINQLRSLFDENQIAVISQDNYYKIKELQLIDQSGVINFDLPSSLELEHYYQDIQSLVAGDSVSRDEYTFNNAKKISKKIIIHPAPIIIAEGLFVFAEKRLQDLYDLKIMIDATDDKKIIRRIKRDRLERNYPLEDVLYRYENHVVPSYKLHIEPYKSVVDIIINNNSHFKMGLEILRGFIESILANNNKMTN